MRQPFVLAIASLTLSAALGAPPGHAAQPGDPGATPAPVTAAPAEAPRPAPGILFILDASGSMKAKIGAQEKIVIAKGVMTNLLRDLPDAVQVGLSAYGHHSKGDCNDIEMIAPIGQSDKNTLIQRIQALDPKGMTPITQALQLAAERLKSLETETTVVLVSDGEETCKGDPCAAVASLVQQGIKFKVNVVGFDVKDKEKQQLLCIAKAGNGKYFRADNAEQLKGALTEVKREVVKKIEVSAVTPEKVVNEKVIKINRPATGNLEIVNHVSGLVYIEDQQTKEKKAEFCNGCASNTQVPVGTYRVRFPNFVIEGVEVGAGEKKTIDVNTVAGMVKIENNLLGIVQVVDQQTGAKRAEFCNSCGSNLQIPPGLYQLKFQNFTVPNIAVKAGETTLFDANTVAGTIEIKNHEGHGFLTILDQKTGEKKAEFCNGCNSNTQVPAGIYKLQYPNFTAENILVEAGQRVVIE